MLLRPSCIDSLIYGFNHHQIRHIVDFILKGIRQGVDKNDARCDMEAEGLSTGCFDRMSGNGGERTHLSQPYHMSLQLVHVQWPLCIV